MASWGPQGDIPGATSERPFGMTGRALATAFLAIAAAGCTTTYSDVDPAGGWREEKELACMEGRTAQPGIRTMPAIVDEQCGMTFPLEVSAFGGSAAVQPVAMLGCPATSAIEAWFRESVQPAAMAWIGAPVVEVSQMSSYACRKRNNIGSEFSEHAFGNALDVSGFRFANGRSITVARDWKGDAKVQGFFREIYATACQRFTTTIGPGSNIMHYNHIHIDLAKIAPDNTPKMCKPAPEVTPPQRQPIDGGPVAAAPVAASGVPEAR
jgi:hypothetical protein